MMSITVGRGWKMLLGAAALAAAGLTAGLSPASAQAKKADDVRIVFVTHGQANDQYWTVVKNGMMAAAAALKVKVEYEAPETFDVVKMGQLIQAATASKPDGLVVSIPDATALQAPIEAAKAAGIPVIVIDSGAEQVKPWKLDLFVGGGSEYDNGKQAGDIMGKAGVKEAICINHEVGNGSLDQRCQGFTDGLKPLGGTVSIVAVTLDPTDSVRRVEGYLTAHPNVTGALMLGTTLAGPMLTMFDERGYAGKLKVGTFDLAPEVLDALSNGKMMFAIDNQQYMMGYLPVVFLTTKALYKTFPTADVLTGPAFVSKADAAAIKTLSDQGIR
jgi:simple sugar transport system substrate-binding protein